ncbi:cytochrome P450 [Chondromyces crocatus]|uniref:Cytochrome P450 n=1 Tax=Chondromyces crocatus TaxID=52 RepID=A0A0K1EPG2_CHOCO|nr:cytochrome P450 [Chondromyces crocatus]AKT42542.1 cytochrome P450 [Chondromyces crocatus]
MDRRSSFEVTSTSFFSDPYPTLRRLHDERPVYYHEPINAWFLVKYEHCEAVVRDPRFSSVRARELLHTLLPALRGTEGLDALVAQFSRLLWFVDPPRHTQLRSMVNRGFSASAIERMREKIRTVVQRALSRIGDGGEVDVVGDFADPIAIDVLCALFGLPEADSDVLRAWTSDLGKVAGASWADGTGGTDAKDASSAFAAYLKDLIADRIAHPGEDMVSRFLEGAGSAPEDIEGVIDQCYQVIGASYLPTCNQIGNAVLTLLQHPGELQRLRTTPELFRSAVEEILRFEPSTLTTNRIASEDIELGGERILRGQLVFPVLAGANRDPAVFPEPERFDIGRRGARHLTFSVGPHYCAGGALVRMQLEEALQALLTFDTWELAGACDFRGSGLQDRGLATLPVRFSRRPRSPRAAHGALESDLALLEV